ncbi:tyrosine-protein phosphatase siw14 [Rhodosporidiobolus nylandii]
MPPSPPSPASCTANEVPAWLIKIARDRTASRNGRKGGVRREVDGTPARVSGCGGEDKDAARSGDLGTAEMSSVSRQEDDGGQQRVAGDTGGPGGAERAPLEEDDLSPGQEGLEAIPPSSRYSYGDFSSASSTASSSTSTSGFSTHSASSATTVSSTTTFSAATGGWGGQACHPLQGFTACAQKALDFEEGNCDADTPTAESCESAGPFSVPVSPTTHADETITFSSLSISAPVEPAPLHLDRPASPSTASVSSTVPGEQPPLPPSDDSILTPPENFAMVSAGLYRSSFPRSQNFSFLRSLGLKSVLTLVESEYPQENLDFYEAEGIQFFQIPIPSNKEPFVSIPEDKLVAALAVALDARNLPMLIHCNKGKHRTGCLIGVLRRLQAWSLTAVFEEYRRYSHPKSRALDLQCIEMFGGLPTVWRTVDHAFLPSWAEPDPPPSPPPAPPP